MTVVVDYDPKWPLLFDRLRRRIEPALHGLAARVEHVGSTSVPGLAGKPIIDVDVVLSHAADVAAAIARIETLGYRHNGDQGITGREVLKQPADDPIRHHLYVVVDGTPPHRDHVDLRDRLRQHPEECAIYATRKRDVAHLYESDPDAYVAAKSDVVAAILAAARQDSR